MRRKTKLKKFLQNVIKQFGKEHQLMLVIEELSELQKEIVKHSRFKNNQKQIIEELADVYIMLEQLKIIYDISQDELTSEMARKLKRLKERMG